MAVKKVSKNIIQTTYFCDICERVIGTSARTCSLCKRLICSTCYKRWSVWDSDYPNKYCPSCYDVGEKFRELLKEEEDRHNNEVEKLESDWKEAALAKLREGLERS